MRSWSPWPVPAPALAGGEPTGSMRTWVDFDYLAWWLKSAPTGGPLLTTGPLPFNAPQEGSGILGKPGTELVVGDTPFNQGAYSGFRVSTGWIHCSNAFGFDGSFFYLGQRTRDFSFNSDATGNPLLARPIIDARTNTETALLVSAPGAFGAVQSAGGHIDLASTSQLYGADANLIIPVERECNIDEYDTIHCHYFHLLAGGRYLNLREDLNISQLTTIQGTGIGFFGNLPVTAPNALGIVDDFHTLNEFFGGQVGAAVGFEWWRFTLNASGKVALGTMRETVRINGSSILDAVGQKPQVIQGGLFALDSNIGEHVRHTFAVVPEGTVNLSFEITSQIKLMVGYTFLYVSSVARPADQVDRAVNRTDLPTSQSYDPAVGGPHRPTFLWQGNDFWAQGVNFGLGFRF